MMATPVRDERFTLLLTMEERELLDAMAERAGLDRSTLIRLRVFAVADAVFPGSRAGDAAGDATGDTAP
jgi:hypothetical protein